MRVIPREKKNMVEGVDLIVCCCFFFLGGDNTKQKIREILFVEMFHE